MMIEQLLMFFIQDALFMLGYLSRASVFPKPLEREEEERLIGKASQGDSAAREKLIAETADALKAQNALDIAKRAHAVQDEMREMHRELDALNQKLASSKLDEVLASCVAIGSCRLATARFDGMQPDVARSLADDIKANHDDIVAVLAIADGARISFIAVAGKTAVANGAHAGKLVGAVAALTGGEGGGRPDNAMAGGKDAAKIDEALACAKDILASQLG